jgi:coiled-coil and C2 domain-containing protein 1
MSIYVHVQQYQDAIKANKAGRPVDFEELPTPPGFEEIPLPGKTAPEPNTQVRIINKINLFVYTR